MALSMRLVQTWFSSLSFSGTLPASSVLRAA